MSARKFLFFLSIFLFILFVYFSLLVSKETFTQFDFDTTVKIQNHISRRADLPFSLFSLLGMAEITGFIWLVFFIFILIKRYWLTALAMLSFWGALGLEVFGKLFVFHPGPPFLFYRGVFKFEFPSSYAHTSYSYPSGHLTRTAFLISFLIVFIYLKTHWSIKMLIIPSLALFLILMAMSRICLGEHWTSDVIGGILLGTSAGIFTGVTIPLKQDTDGLI